MIIGLMIFVLYLNFFAGSSELLRVMENLNSMNYVFYYSLAIAATVVGVLAVAASWHSLLRSLDIQTNLKSLFIYTWAGSFVDLVVPCQAVCGEVTRIYLVRKENHQNYGAIAASSVTNRIVSYVVSSVGLLGAVFLLLSSSSAVPSYLLSVLVVALVGTSVYLAVLFYLALGAQAAGKLTGFVIRLTQTLRMGRFLPSDISHKTEASLSVFHQGFDTFKKKPTLLVKPFVFQLLSFMLNVTAYVFVFNALGLRTLQIDFFILVYFIVGTIQVAAAIFSVGTLEIILTNIFVLYGIPIASAGLAASLLRVLTFWLPMIVGYVTVQAIGAKKLLGPKLVESPGADKDLPSNS